MISQYFFQDRKFHWWGNWYWCRHIWSCNSIWVCSWDLYQHEKKRGAYKNYLIDVGKCIDILILMKNCPLVILSIQVSLDWMKSSEVCFCLIIFWPELLGAFSFIKLHGDTEWHHPTDACHLGWLAGGGPRVFWVVPWNSIPWGKAFGSFPWEEDNQKRWTSACWCNCTYNLF